VTGTCFFCQEVGPVEIDHVVGRIDGEPIHAGLVVEACGPCNRRRWHFWYQAGLASSSPTQAEMLRRLATFHAMREGPLDMEEADFLVSVALKLERAA
jgi:hypothetical protein